MNEGVPRAALALASVLNDGNEPIVVDPAPETIGTTDPGPSRSSAEATSPTVRAASPGANSLKRAAEGEYEESASTKRQRDDDDGDNGDGDGDDTMGCADSGAAQADSDAQKEKEELEDTTPHIDGEALAEHLAQELQCGCCAELAYRPVIVSPCQHFFCGSCCVLWIKNGGTSCPACRGLSTGVTPSRALQAMIDVLLRAAPHRARTERERVQADEVYPVLRSLRFPEPREPSPEPHIPPASDFARPCPHCSPNNPFGWRCPNPIADPSVDQERAWPLEDGAPPGHGFCGNCETLLALTAPTTTKCDLCQVSFCGIAVAGRCAALPLQQQVPHGLTDVGDLIQSAEVYDAFDGNTVEVEFLLDYLGGRPGGVKGVYREIIAHILSTPEGFTPLIASDFFADMHPVQGGADPDPAAPRQRCCRLCAAEVLLWGLREWWVRERRMGRWDGEGKRKDCEEGRACRRQGDLEHAREFSHIVIPPAEPQPEAQSSQPDNRPNTNSNPITLPPLAQIRSAPAPADFPAVAPLAFPPPNHAPLVGTPPAFVLPSFGSLFARLDVDADSGAGDGDGIGTGGLAAGLGVGLGVVGGGRVPWARPGRGSGSRSASASRHLSRTSSYSGVMAGANDQDRDAAHESDTDADVPPPVDTPLDESVELERREADEGTEADMDIEVEVERGEVEREVRVEPASSQQSQQSQQGQRAAGAMLGDPASSQQSQRAVPFESLSSQQDRRAVAMALGLDGYDTDLDPDATRAEDDDVGVEKMLDVFMGRGEKGAEETGAAAAQMQPAPWTEHSAAPSTTSALANWKSEVQLQSQPQPGSPAYSLQQAQSSGLPPKSGFLDAVLDFNAELRADLEMDLEIERIVAASAANNAAGAGAGVGAGGGALPYGIEVE